MNAAIGAGKLTLKYYKQHTKVETKSDLSPITQADKDSDDHIQETLLYTGIPVLSEESAKISFEERKKWDIFWLVDPLDGTREFINSRDEFTVNIALIQNTQPVLGVVYVPVFDLLFIGIRNKGAFKINDASQMHIENWAAYSGLTKIPSVTNLPLPVLVASKSHQNDETTTLISKFSNLLGELEIQTYGSSLKLCMIADGFAHIYPRLGPTMEWDTAASHAIVEASGCIILQFPELKPLQYNKKELLNPWFIVFQPNFSKHIQKLAEQF